MKVFPVPHEVVWSSLEGSWVWAVARASNQCCMVALYCRNKGRNRYSYLVSSFALILLAP